MTLPLNRGRTIGIIGGGQLGRLLAMAAARLGFQTVILEPQENCPASQVANKQIVAAYDDSGALRQLAEDCAVVTYEFENVDADALSGLQATTPIYPPLAALKISQDRVVEKTFLANAGLETAPWQAVAAAEELAGALKEFGGRGILKTRRFGYDGKGQIRFSGDAGDMSADEAMSSVANTPSILEGFVDFACEISVIVTRGLDGETVCFDPARNVHEGGILATSNVPTGLGPAVETKAKQLASQLAVQLNYVGTLGLEFFVTADGQLIANEFAPRVHNSGHWTEAACTISQFEQHIRAICGWHLGDGNRHSDCEMGNILGENIQTLAALAADGAVVVNDYGKAEAKPGRKMGHFTRLLPRK